MGECLMWDDVQGRYTALSEYVRALAVSDTHGNRRAMDEIIRAYSDILYVFHLGDCVRDADYLARHMKDAVVLSVRGNCDPGSDRPAYEDIIIKGQKIILTHGHTLQVKYSLDRLLYYAQEREAQAILFGHTHVPFAENDNGIWMVNPGSAGQGRMHDESVAMLLIGEAGIIPKILKLRW